MGAKSFQKSRRHLKILGAIKVVAVTVLVILMMMIITAFYYSQSVNWFCYLKIFEVFFHNNKIACSNTRKTARTCSDNSAI
jgi:hypothetical protein